VNDAVPAGFQPVPHRGGDFIDANGPVYLKREGLDAVLGFRVEMRHCNPGRVAHGGMLMAMLDDMMGYVIYEILDRKPAATASLTCDFLAAARLGAWVEVRCRTTRVASALIFMRGEVSADGQPVMTASGLWKRLGA